jgi:chitinase
MRGFLFAGLLFSQALVAAPQWPSRVFAPYVDATAWPPFPLTKAADKAGVLFFNLGFIVAKTSTACIPSWGGYYGIGSYLKAKIASLRGQGGDVAISFGGAAGTELAAACRDPATLARQYQAVIDGYGLTRIDFDVEGASVADRASVDRRSQAIALLQKAARAAGRKLAVWFTLPVLPTGLDANGLAVVDSALVAGVRIAGVNIMAMDYGDAAAPNPDGQMGDYAIQAAGSLWQQLKDLYQAHGIARSDAQLWHQIGVTPMIGRNDVLSEVFYPADAGQLLDFAARRNLGMLSFWSANRDQLCPGGAVGYVEASCSSILQAPYAFSGILKAFSR